MMNQNKPKTFLLRLLQGGLIGLGAVLPGISGGVLCVIFGIYKPIMELLSDPGVSNASGVCVRSANIIGVLSKTYY